MDIIQTLAQQLNLTAEQVGKTVQLIDEGNTIPFIARYRKEVTGSLDDSVLRTLDEKLTALRNLAQRKQEVQDLIGAQGKLTEELSAAIDNAATLAEVCGRYPGAQVMLTAKGAQMAAQFFGDGLRDRLHAVSDGAELVTGRHHLRFFTAPMVHWPEVMVTWDETDRVLFSADAFGAFGAVSGFLFADEVDFARDWLDDARRYYTNIVGKYGVQVQAVLKKAAALDIQMICPLHGPIWRENLGTLLEKYQKWSTYEPEDKTVMIAYATMYGNTENAVNVLANMLADKGVKNIAMYDVSETDVSELVAESFRCSHIVLAAPTYNGGVQPKMEAYLSDIKALALQNRTVAIIDNGTWAPTAGKQMRAVIDTMKNMTVLENLKIGAYLRKDKEEIEKDIEWVYELFPRLKERNWQLAGTLSGGEQQMLAVGRGLMSRPKVLMMDEPSLGLAPLVVQGIFDIIREINRQGVTILLIEQNANMALKIADLAYVLETGTITMSGTGAELLADEKVKEAYLGKKRSK